MLLFNGPPGAGMVIDHRSASDGTITAGDPSTLKSATAAWTTSDVGKAVVVAKAGPAGVGGNLPHTTTIAAVIDTATVTLTSPAVVAATGTRVDWGTDNTAALQTAANTGVVDVPAGRLLAVGTVVAAGSLVFRGAGRDATTIVHPSWADLISVTAPDRSTVTFQDFTIQGPTGVAPHQQVTYGAIRWLRDLTYNATMTVRRVNVVGTFDTAVARSGGGLFEVEDCHLEGTDSCAWAFESLNAVDRMFVTARGCTFTCPNGDGSTQGSVGFYVHPHVPYLIEQCRFVNMGRYGVYENGTPTSKRRPSTISGCTFIDAEIVKSETRGRTLIVGCTARGSLSRLGSVLYGHETRFDGCTFENCGPQTTYRSAAFTGCTFINTQVGVSSDPSASGLHLAGCRFKIDAAFPGNCVEAAGSAPYRVVIDGCDFEDTTTAGTAVGKALYLPGANHEATVRNCSFRGFRDPGNSAVVFTRGARLRLENCEIDNRQQGTVRGVSVRTPGSLEGSNNAFLGTTQFAVWDGTAQQRLTRRPGVNPTPAASAASIDTNTAAWLNWDTHVVTGSTPIVTLANPWVAVGAVRLIVADGASWSTANTGNIAPRSTNPRPARTVVTLLWEPSVGKWLEV